MFITANNGDFHCTTIEEYKNALALCLCPENELWISLREGSDELPSIGIVTNAANAAVTYFETDGAYLSALGDTAKLGAYLFAEGQYEIVGE